MAKLKHLKLPNGNTYDFHAIDADQVNGHTVASDVPSNATFTDTTYTFANGTNGFTVTPSGGTAQTVTVTPSITNNVTGSGTSGYLVKFNGANTITNGAQLGSDTTKFLRNDGEWAVPPGAGGGVTGVKGDAESTYRTGNVNLTPANLGLESKSAASGGTDLSLVTTGEKYTWNNKASSDTKVAQTISDSETNYYSPIFSYSATSSSSATEGARKTQYWKYRPDKQNMIIGTTAAYGIYSKMSYAYSVGVDNYISPLIGTDDPVQSITIFGDSMTARGNYSMFVGSGHSSNGNYNWIKGKDNNTQGSHLNVSGEGLYVRAQNQTVFGKYNEAESVQSTNIEIVGNGTADNARSNARTLDWSGNEWLAGTLTASGATINGSISVSENILSDDSSLDITHSAPSSDYWSQRGIYLRDINQTEFGRVRGYYLTDGEVGVEYETKRTVGGTVKYNNLNLGIDSSGNSVVSVSSPSAWRTALGLKDWVEVDHKGGTTPIAIPSGTTEICCVITVGNNTIAWTFTLPYAALSSTSWRYTNAYTSVSDGYIAVNVSTAQVSLNAVYNGKSNVTNSSILYLYAR